MKNEFKLELCGFAGSILLKNQLFCKNSIVTSVRPQGVAPVKKRKNRRSRSRTNKQKRKKTKAELVVKKIAENQMKICEVTRLVAKRNIKMPRPTAHGIFSWLHDHYKMHHITEIKYNDITKQVFTVLDHISEKRDQFLTNRFYTIFWFASARLIGD